jgi:hypothetical protein
MFDVLILLAKIKKRFGKMVEMGGLFFGVGFHRRKHNAQNLPFKSIVVLLRSPK